MRARLERLLGAELAKELWVGTFHATCARLLRRHGAGRGCAANFVIYDAHDQKTVVKRAIKELDLDEKRYPPRQVLARIHKEKQEGREPDRCSGTGIGYMDDAVRRVFERYEAQLARGGRGRLRRSHRQDAATLDAADEQASEAQVRLRARRRVPGHERLQYELVRLLSSSTRNLCVVGDDDQSIYRWRGADVATSAASSATTPTRRSSSSSRTTARRAHIVQAALGVIEPSSDREPKELWTDNDGGRRSRCRRRARRARRGGARRRDDSARRARGRPSFARSPSSTASTRSRACSKRRCARRTIPYQIVGGTKFFERAEIKDALAYLRVLVNAKSDVDLLRVINTPPRGIGQATVDKLERARDERSVRRSSTALARLDESAEIAGAPMKKLRAVRDLLACR